MTIANGGGGSISPLKSSRRWQRHTGVGGGCIYAKLENIVRVGLEAIVGNNRSNVSLSEPGRGAKKCGCNMLIAQSYVF